MLQFLCPNGHKIHCPADQAGRAAKCPKCGVAFKVPNAEQLTPDQSVTAEMASGVGKTGSDSNSEAAKPPAKKEPQIEFLCPNGHRLHGPASMQGHAGQCPECGSKFRIPNYDDTGEDEEEGTPEEPDDRVEEDEFDDAVDVVQDESSSGSKAGAEDTAVATLPHPVAIVGKSARTDAGSAPSQEVGLNEAQSATAAAHAWRDLFIELWRQKTAGVVVEVLLDDGETLIPERFAADSSGQHALFAIKNSNATHTVTAVGWCSVVRVMVRGLKTLPTGLFGE